MNNEFIVYSITKSSFQSLVDSGGITTSQIGIISETAEFWAKGQYYPLVNLGEYLKKDDAVDFAKDLQGKVETTEETFSFRASAGDKSIRDSSAVITKIKGNSVVWNQYVTNGDFSAGITGWRGLNATIGLSNNTLSITNSSTSGCGAQIAFARNIKSGHKVLVVVDYKKNSSSSSQCRAELVPVSGTLSQSTMATSASTTRRIDSIIMTPSTDVTSLKIYPNYNGASGSICTVFSVQVFDLTEMFGIGNEPTYAEFSKMYPEGYYAQSQPTIRGMCAYSIDTVGFNCFNNRSVYASYISSTTGTTTSSSVYSTSEYIKVLKGETYYLKDVRGGGSNFAYALYDSSKRIISTGGFSNNGTNAASGSITIPNTAYYLRVVVHNSFLNTCCVNLQHSAVSNGTYAEYLSNSRVIPEIKNIFPYGMHRIGDVYDEITSECAIKRIGVREYASGDVNSNTMLTDGVTRTIYVLGTPDRINIETPIQLEYYVEDFGTEDVSFWDRSTPLCADIAYRFNAEGRIRDNSRNIERLENKFDSLTTGSTPYIFKSITAIDFVECEGGSLQLDIDIDDLQGGEISEALRAKRPVYIRAGGDDSGFSGIIPMTYIFEEDMIYYSFVSGIDQYEYFGEINGVEASVGRRLAHQGSSSSIANSRIIISSSADVPDEMEPDIVYELTFSPPKSLQLPVPTDSENNYDHEWIFRMQVVTGFILTYPVAIMWDKGVSPTWTSAGVLEIKLKLTTRGLYLGSWNLYY